MGKKKSTYRSNFTEDEWRELIARHEASGLTQARFCEQEHISPKTFSYRRAQLLKTDSDNNWVEVVPAATTKPEPAATPNASPIVVHVGQYKVECRNGFDATLLREVCEALSCHA